MEDTKRSLRAVGVRYLTPQNCRLYIGTLGSLHCIVDDKEAYANVYCLMTFPISYPYQYISVCYSDEEGKEQEIGVIESLDQFPLDVQQLVKNSLGQHYFEQIIYRIYDTRWEYGLIFFDVETDSGRKQFSMRWQHDKALEYGRNGKVLLDTFNNRYVIPAVSELPASDRNRLLRFIYW